jgi:Ca2+-binding RTX toxin-like protein
VPNERRTAFSAALLHVGRVLVVGGRQGSSTNVNKGDLFDSTTNTWSSTPDPPYTRRSHTETAAPGRPRSPTRSGIENVTGSAFDDNITGDDTVNVLIGGGGADHLFGLGGNDTIKAVDHVGGNDTVDGGAGTDKCKVDAGDGAANCP